jgi:hypothetical protein
MAERKKVRRNKNMKQRKDVVKGEGKPQDHGREYGMKMERRMQRTTHDRKLRKTNRPMREKHEGKWTRHFLRIVISRVLVTSYSFYTHIQNPEQRTSVKTWQYQL